MADKEIGAAEIIEAVGKMTVLELSELVKALEEKFGVTAAAPVMAAAPSTVTAEVSVKEAEKTAFDVVLKEVGPKKIAVIKVVRELTGLGLRESKDLVDTAPGPVRKGVTRQEADDAKARLEEEGAVVEID